MSFVEFYKYFFGANITDFEFLMTVVGIRFGNPFLFMYMQRVHYHLEMVKGLRVAVFHEGKPKVELHKASISDIIVFITSHNPSIKIKCTTRMMKRHIFSASKYLMFGDVSVLNSKEI